MNIVSYRVTFYPLLSDEKPTRVIVQADEHSCLYADFRREHGWKFLHLEPYDLSIEEAVTSRF